MRIEKTERGFREIIHDEYASEDNSEMRIVCESSAIGKYDDSLEKPGSSYLWVGENHHLNREEVSLLAESLYFWLLNQKLPESIEEMLEEMLEETDKK